MPESKKGLNIKFVGKLENLVINYEGKVLYSYKREKIKEREKTEKEKANYHRTKLVNAFCSQINQVTALKWIWRLWPKRGRSAYRNMIAANMPIARAHLNALNKITPLSKFTWGPRDKSLTLEKFSFKVKPFGKEMEKPEPIKTASIISIFYLYDPIKLKRSSFHFFTKSLEQPEYDVFNEYNINLEFTPAEKKELKAYKTGIIFIAIVLSELKGHPNQWAQDTLCWDR